MTNIITDINKIIGLARQAGKIILGYYNSDYDIETKTDDSPVTQADIAADKFIVAGLQEIAPNIPIISEEGNKDLPAGATRYWLVDPLDGTKGFISKTGQFTVNIGLIEDGKPTLGVIYIPTEDKMYWGSALGAFLDGAPISCRQSEADGLVVVASKSHRDAQTDAYVQHLNVKKFVPAASSLKFCMLAEGEADLYPRYGTTMEWDVAAGHAILLAAGGAMTNPDGSEFQYGKPEWRNSGGFVARGL
jgi:3'(2'), 5'-bisphosphate nucleotidase